MALFLFTLTEKRKAAVGMPYFSGSNINRTGRREMELVLLGYAIINICEIFSLGGFLTNIKVIRVRLSDSSKVLTLSGSLLFRSVQLQQQYGFLCSMH